MMKQEITSIPVKLMPNRVRRNYRGGRTLDRIAGVESAADGNRPEEWLLSEVAAVNPGMEPIADEGISQVILPDGRVMPLPAWIAAAPAAVLGPGYDGRSAAAGVLVKFLDSSIRLHMQCHPTAEFALKHFGVNAGKTEGYYILGCREEVEPYIYLGFQRQPEKSEFRRSIVEQDIPALLSGFDRITIKPGDAFIVPGGVPHAIGEGIFMVEIMEPTDFAVRIEFEREGIVLPEPARFMKRDVDFALSLFDFRARSEEETRQAFFAEPLLLAENGAGKHWSVLDERHSRCFRLETLELGKGKFTLATKALQLLVVTAGEGAVICGDTRIELKYADRVLLPAAALPVRVETRSNLKLAIARR